MGRKPGKNPMSTMVAPWLRNWSLKHKLIAAIMLTCVGALLLTGVIFTVWEWTSLRRAMILDLSTHADILAENCKAAIAFEDATDANDILRTVDAVPAVQVACVYTKDGTRFATYVRAETTASIPDPNDLPRGHTFTGNLLTLIRPISLDGEQIGTICLTSNLDPLRIRLKHGIIAILGILCISSLGAYLASSRLQGIISSPILYLAGVANFVSEKRQYAIRAEKYGADEVGLLIEAFNEMLEQIQQRDSALVNANEQLEERVRERTAALSSTNEKLTREIAIRKKAEQVLKQRAEQIVHHQRTLVKLSKHANDDLMAIIRSMTEETAATLSTARVGVWLLADETRELVCRDLFKQKENTHEEGPRMRAADYPHYFQAIESSRIVAANNAEEDARTSELAASHLRPLGITSLINVSIQLQGRMLGVVSCEHIGQPREWTLEEQDFAASLADMIALQIEANERRKAERALARVNKHLADTVRELRRSNKELQDFAYVTAHDLKAPLRGIGTLTDWIASDYADKFDAQGQEQLGLLKGRVSRMSELIDGILHYSEIGRTSKCREWVDLNKLLPEVIAQLVPPEDMEITIEDPLPELVIEKVRLIQVFQNLIGNAIKYMDKPQGRIRINCTGDEHFWTFSVSDNGPGIDEKYFDKIFQMFQTLTRRDELESTGIGLSMVKKIVELHGGTVWVESQVGEGTTFSFTLPKQEVAPLEAETQTHTTDGETRESTDAPWRSPE
ncbi:MAG: GAF domain-containing protein [Phycisphaerales bacterium]|nr:MAG: GAF domain-containing protein [Phycisphaerales bacterium]